MFLVAIVKWIIDLILILRVSCIVVYTNAIDLCLLIVSPVTLLISLNIIVLVAFVDFLGCPSYTIILTENIVLLLP